MTKTITLTEDEIKAIKLAMNELDARLEYFADVEDNEAVGLAQGGGFEDFASFYEAFDSVSRKL